MTGVLPSLRQEKTDPRSENRVVGSPRSSAACAGSILSEPVELRQENGSIGTATVSGVWCWLAKDPILFAGGQANLYVYCGNDPINRIDPLGLAEECSIIDKVQKWVDGHVFVISFQAQFVAVMGAEFALTLAIGNDDITVGFSAGAAVGLDIGVGVATGFLSGDDSTAILGPYSNLSGSIGYLTGDKVWTPSGAGEGIILGPGFGYGFAGGHWTLEGVTKCVDHKPDPPPK